MISRMERVGDTLIILACFVLSYYGRSSLLLWNDVFGWNLRFGGSELAPMKDYFIVLAVALASYTVMLNMSGAYSSMRLSSHWTLLRISILTSVVVFFVLAAVLFTLKIDLSRSFIALFCSLVALTLTAERYVALNVLRFLRRNGKNFRNVIICGIGEQALRLAQEICIRPELGIRVRGFADLRVREGGDSRAETHFKQLLRRAPGMVSRRVIHGGAALERSLKEYVIDEVIFTDLVEVMPEVEEMVLICSEQGVRTTIAADLFSVGMVKSGLSYFGSMPLIHYQTPPGDRWELVVKRWIDVGVSAGILLLLAPLFLLIALGIRWTSPGPIFFTQRRVGLGGRVFDLYKFRSMQLGAESMLPELLNQNEMSGPAFKMKNDPRVTSFGRLLRRYSLDELPQLWNVIKGDMSLVGPRPPVPGEVTLYERRDRRRLSMRPGLTCTWQVSGRNEIVDFNSWVKLDLEYIDNWSLQRDLLLLFRTIPAVLFGTGAR